MSSVSATKGVAITLQAAGTTTGNGIAVNIPPGFKNHTIIVIGTAGISAGAVQVESADSDSYAGTWNAEGSPLAAAASAEVAAHLTGVFLALRARVSTTVVGGTITVIYFGS